MKIKIACLPVAGIENPYQFLMIKGLKSDNRLDVISGIDDRFFGILRTAIIHKPDYIHFDWETSYYYRKNIIFTLISIPIFIFQVLICKYFYNCKLVWTPHNLIPHDSKWLILHRFCRRFFARQMTWIRVFSELSVERAISELKCGKDKIRVISEGSYVGYYPNNVNRFQARDYFNISNDKLVFLYAGYIKPYKGITKLISAFNKIYSKKNVVLIIAGKSMDSIYFEQIRKIKNDNILIINKFIVKDEIQYYFNVADIVILPFEKIENSGSVILAMSFKKPVITPKIGLLTDRLKNQSELLYEKNVEDSFKILEKLNESDLNEIGEKNYLELEKYKWEDFTKLFS